MVKKPYPLIRCYNPRVIMNKYTGELVEVGCGVCKACLQRRAGKMSFLCSMEEVSHKYCMFVTLTYAPEYAPLMYPVVDEKSDVIRWVSKCDRLGDKGNVVAFDSNHRSSMRDYLSLLLPKVDPKGELHGCMTYCSKRDVQLFLKRVRKSLSKYSDEKIRYYAVSEYGPKTFRAHYHVLFFYDKPETNKYFRRCVRIGWSEKTRETIKKGSKKHLYKRRSLGRVDMSLSRGKCTSYVARYVNSTCFIPPFLGSVSAKPFALHSRFFAQGVYRSQRAEIYANAPEDFVQLGGELSGSYVEFMPWRSLAFTFFPKCKGYGCKSDCELWRSYNILREAESFFGSSFKSLSLPRIAENILDAIVSYKWPSCLSCVPKFKPCEQYFLDYFACDIDENPYRMKSDDKQDWPLFFTNRILSELYTSRHFLTYVCDNDSLSERRHKFGLIKRFWRKYDYTLLVDMYMSQVELLGSHCSDYSWFYVNKVPLLTLSSSDCHDLLSLCLYKCQRSFQLVDASKLYKERFYQDFVVSCEKTFENSVKHKSLNDANLIFCQ